MTLAKVIDGKRLSAFAVVIGALNATSLSAAELSDQPPLRFLSVAAFLLFVSFACRFFESCDDNNAHANRTGAIAARSGFVGIGITTIRSVRAASQNRFALGRGDSRGSSAYEILQAGSFRLAGMFQGGRRGNRYLPRSQ